MMILVVIAWLYVALMMAVAEATSPVGSVLGAVITFLLYGVGPAALAAYLLMTPARRRQRRAAEAAQLASTDRSGHRSVPPDAGGHAPADAVAPVRKEP